MTNVVLIKFKAFAFEDFAEGNTNTDPVGQLNNFECPARLRV